MNIPTNDIHIGQAIEKRRSELEISKSELGRRIGIPQQHVNRILERDTMETKRLVKICEVLDFNFFSLFCPLPTQVSTYLSAISFKGDANNLIGDAALLAQMEKMKGELKEAQSELEHEKRESHLLKEQIAFLEANLKDKDSIIELLKERR